tara:strand:+ start:724 stop:1113 length:390 start_codon:yes stop_codon:yes gene_type:complete
MKNKALSILSLFTSSGTLICCALPALVATLAGGAAVSGMVAAFPVLIPISQTKGWIFLIGGLLLILNGSFVFRTKKEVACEVGEETACEIVDRFNRRMFFVSCGVYSIGAFSAYGLVPVLQFFETWSLS